MRKVSVMSAAVIAALIGLGASAQSLKVRQYAAEQDAALQVDELAPTNTACQSKITASIDWSKYSESAMGKYSASGYCATALSGIRQICDNKLGLEAVQQKIQRLTCAFGPPGGRTVALKDGTLSFTVDWEAANNEDYVREYLLNAL